MNFPLSKLFLIACTAALHPVAQPLYLAPKGTDRPLSSFENLNGVKGGGAITNSGARGNLYETVMAFTTKSPLNMQEERTWLTINQNQKI